MLHNSVRVCDDIEGLKRIYSIGGREGGAQDGAGRRQRRAARADAECVSAYLGGLGLGQHRACGSFYWRYHGQHAQAHDRVRRHGGAGVGCVKVPRTRQGRGP